MDPNLQRWTKDPHETNAPTDPNLIRWSSDNATSTNSQSQTEPKEQPDNLLQQASRVTAHSLYGGVVRPTLGLANLGTELANGAWHALGGKSNLNYYTNEALNKADELDRDLDRGKEDWASSDSLASDLGSWASLLIPIGGELKLADKAADVGKRLLDKDTYDKEQAIKNSFNKIKNAISPSIDDGLSVNKDLNKELENLNRLHQKRADMEMANASDDQLNAVENQINKSKENIKAFTDHASKIADKKENINDVVSKELDNIESQHNTLNPNLPSSLIDYGITGRKGKGIIPAAVMGAAYGAGESSNKDSLTQVENAIGGATVGGASTGLLHYLANGGTNLLSYFKIPQTNRIPQLSPEQESNIKKLVNTEPAISKSKISENTKELGYNISPNIQYLMDMKEYAKAPPASYPKFSQNNKEAEKEAYYKTLATIVKNANVQKYNLPNRSSNVRNEVKLTSNQLSNNPEVWKRSLGLSSGYVENPKEYSYNSQWNSFMPAMMRHLQYPNLSPNKTYLDFINNDLAKAYDDAIKRKYEIPFKDHSNDYLEYVKDNLSSIKDKNPEIQSLLDLGIKSTKAYKTLEDSVNLLDTIVPKDKELDSIDWKNHIKNIDIRPSVKSRILEELDKTDGDSATAISNLRKSRALYNTSSYDQLKNKILNHQNELNTQTSKDFNGGDISVYNMNQYKSKIKDIGEDQNNSESRDIYHELAKKILPTFTKYQDNIYNYYLQNQDKDGKALDAFSSGKSGKRNLQSVTKILRQLNDNVESGEAVHQLLKDSGYGDINDPSKLTQTAINERASMVDQGVDAFIKRIDDLSKQGNTNAINLKKEYKGDLENLRENFKNLAEYASKKVGTLNANNNTISDEARSAILGSAPDIRKYDEQQKENDRRIKAELDYIANQQLFGGLTSSRNPIAGFKHGLMHGVKHLWAVAGVHDGKLDTYMDENVKNLLSPNLNAPDDSPITHSRSQLVSFHRPVDVNNLFEGDKLEKNIRNIDENTLVPIHNKELDTVKYVPLKDIKHPYQIEQAINYIYDRAQNISNNQKTVKSRVSDMQRTSKENLNNNFQKLGALHYLLPRSVLSVPTVTGSMYPAYYNFLQSRSTLPNNNSNNKDK